MGRGRLPDRQHDAGPGLELPSLVFLKYQFFQVYILKIYSR